MDQTLGIPIVSFIFIILSMCMSACMYMHMGKCPRRPEVSNAIVSPLTEMLGTDIRTQARAVRVLHG